MPDPSHSRASLDESLVSLAIAQLTLETGRANGQETQAFALVAIDVALGVADVGARSGASEQVLRLTRGFGDYWWGPLLGVLVSAALLLVGVRRTRLLLGPRIGSADGVVARFQERHPEISDLRALALAIEGQRLTNMALSRGRARWIMAGRAVLLLSVVGGGVLFLVVR